MTISFHLVGDSCGHHGPYAFYRSFDFCQNGRTRRISLGEFFFVRFSPNENACIAELQLLWEDKNVGSTLTSCRLYYLPENTPEGRLGHHGEDEVLAASDKVVLCAEDLVQRIVCDAQWVRGLKGLYAEDNELSSTSTSGSDYLTSGSESLTHSEVTNAHRSGLSTSIAGPGTGLVDTFIANNNLGSSKKCLPEDQKSIQYSANPDESTVKVLSFPTYCRYRAILKRLENVTETWLRNTLVVALGGFTVPSRNCRLLFCRNTFKHLLLEGNELLHNHLAPTLKGRPRKKRLKNKRSTSPSSESNENESEEGRTSVAKDERPRNGLKKHLEDEDLEEQEFLQRLFKFMRKRNTPIERVPHLGFKQINLYFFYTYAQKLGGYEKITVKKLWKHIYDELGGNPGSTSAATCTRRHYERLLLPYERHTKGEDHMPLPPITGTKCRKNSNASNPPPPPTPSPTHTSSSTQNPTSPSSSISSARPSSPDNSIQCIENKSVEDVALPLHSAAPTPPSPVPQTPEETTSASDDQGSVQKESESSPLPCPLTPDAPLKTATSECLSEGEHRETKKQVAVQPRLHLSAALPMSQVFQHQRKRAKDEKFAEKERMWDEIRRQNAIERDRIRQLAAAARSANSSRLVKAKDLLAKPMGVVSPLETVALQVSYSSTSASSIAPMDHDALVCQLQEGSESNSNSNWLQSNKDANLVLQPGSLAPPPSRCVSQSPLPLLPIKLEDPISDHYIVPTVEKPRMKRTLADYPCGVREQFGMKKACHEVLMEARSIKAEVPNGWRPQEDCVLDSEGSGMPRPSVIQHTHSASLAHSLIGQELAKPPVYGPDHCAARSERKNSFGESLYPRFVSDIPLAHCNSVKCRPRFHPYDHEAVGPESLPQRAGTTKYRVAEVSPLPPMVDPARRCTRPLTSPWNSTSPHGRLMNHCDGPPHLEEDGVVLDLSVKKSVSRGRWTNGDLNGAPLLSRTDKEHDVCELDLSMKNKPKCPEVRAVEERPVPKKSCAPVHFQTTEDEKSIRRCRDALEMRYSSKTSPMSPLPSMGPGGMLQSGTTGTLHVMPNHYYFSDEKTPAYYSEYGQFSALLPPHYYGLPFSVSSSQPPLLSEQLQGSLATYKELFHKGVFPTTAASQYPSFAISSHVYPSLYKEQSPYLYLPK